MRLPANADRMELGIAVATILIGLFILSDSFGIKLGSGYDHIGPRFFPYMVSAGLLLTGVLMFIEVLFKSVITTEAIDWKPFFILCMALAACLLLLKPAGFILAAAVQFWLVARAFNSRRTWRDVVVALLLAVVVYVVFTHGLGLVLPGGFLAGLF